MGITVSSQDFVRIWQGSDSLAEVCQRTGYSPQYASQRASRLRRAAAPGLKQFSRSPGSIEVPPPNVAKAELMLAEEDARIARERAAAGGQDNDETPGAGEEGW